MRTNQPTLRDDLADPIFPLGLYARGGVWIKAKLHQPDRRSRLGRAGIKGITPDVIISAKPRPGTKGIPLRIPIPVKMARELGLHKNREFALGFSEWDSTYVLFPWTPQMEMLHISPIVAKARWQGCFVFDTPTPQERAGAKQFDPFLPFMGSLGDQFFINLERVQIWHDKVVLSAAPRSNRSTKPRLAESSDRLFFEPPSFMALVKNSLFMPKGKHGDKGGTGYVEKTLWYMFSDTHGNLIFQQRPPCIMNRKWKRPLLSDERRIKYCIKT